MMINEYQIGKDVEGSRYGIIKGTTPLFICRDSGKP
jgi:hypothetical protein